MPSYSNYKNHLKVVLDANDDDIESWITVRGNHIPIMKGQSKEEAVKSFLAKKSKKESSVRANKPEHIGKAASKVVKQTAENKNVYKEATKSEFKPILSEKEDPTFKQRTEILEKMKGVERGSKEYKRLSREYMSLLPKKEPHIERKRSALNELVGAAMGPERPRGEKMEKTIKEPDTEETEKAGPIKEKMQEVMNNYYTLYEWEKPALENFAQGLSNDLKKYKGQEKEVLEEYATILNRAVNRMGMWVDTPTLVKREFIKKMQEEYSGQEKTENVVNSSEEKD